MFYSSYMTHPVFFQDLASFKEWSSNFENKALEICRTHNTMELWDKMVLLKDESKLEFAIVSMGAWREDSDHYAAQNKILDAWEDMFGERGFF